MRMRMHTHMHMHTHHTVRAYTHTAAQVCQRNCRLGFTSSGHGEADEALSSSPAGAVTILCAYTSIHNCLHPRSGTHIFTDKHKDTLTYNMVTKVTSHTTRAHMQAHASAHTGKSGTWVHASHPRATPCHACTETHTKAPCTSVQARMHTGQ